jgi:hypothetical protein
MQTPYPKYNVLAKWDSPSFDDKTRRVLADRLHAVPERRFLTVHEWRLVEAISAQLIPQPGRAEAVPITPWIDEHLFAGRGEGFRHDGMPPLRELWREGLAAIDCEARRRYALGFAELDAASRDATLCAIQQGQVDPALWRRIPAQRFFVDILLKTVAEIYYSHPAAWNEIGFGGPASPRGYVRLGFDGRDAWEAEEER